MGPEFPQIVEILTIWSKIFINKNSKNCILLHEFSLFYTILAFSQFFPTFLLKKINNFEKCSDHTTAKLPRNSFQTVAYLVLTSENPQFYFAEIVKLCKVLEFATLIF